MNALGTAVYESLTKAIADIDPNRMVTKAIVVLEYIDGDGERCMSVYGSPDIRGWDIDALASYADKAADEIIRSEIRELLNRD